MLHLSLLTLPRASGRWRFVTSYQLHQALWTAFPDLARGERDKRFLYRHDARDHCHSVLVQSVMQPDWRHVEDEAEGAVARMRTFDAGLIRAGELLRFFLRANPVVQRKGYSDGKNRRVVVGSALARIAERLQKRSEDLPARESLQVEWMKDRGSAGGFEIVVESGQTLCLAGPSQDHVIRRPGSDNPMTFTSVDFTGVLRVTEPELFAETLRRGIGKGKAFGFGLLSVARLNA